MARAIVIADDLTGSNATGVLLKKNGFNTYTALSPGSVSDPALRGCDCLVVPTNSRAIDAKSAYESVSGALRPLISSDVALYAKRVDSTLRGNLGSETDAFLDLLGESYIAVCVPCSPTSGRVLIGGYMLVGGVPLQNTEVAKDPKCPINTSSAMKLFTAQTKHKVASVYIDDIAKGPGSLCDAIKRLRDDGARIIICDSITFSDMDTISTAMVMSGIPYVPVDPGMFTALSAQKLIPTEKASGGKLLCLIGSVNGVAGRQAKKLLSELPVKNVYLNVQEALEGPRRREAEIARIVEQVFANAEDADMLSVIGSGIDPEKRVPFEPYMERDGLTMEQLSDLISGAFAEAAYRVFSRDKSFRALYSTGGDITAAINERFGTVGLRLLDEVVPLGCYGEMVGGEFSGLRFISKGGMVGDENAMVTCARYLKDKL